MKISQNWLHEWVNPHTDLDEFCATITMAGLEVDSIEPAAGEFTHIVVARVIAVEKHSDADKLNVCKVNIGDETLQIVCGAANVREGLMVACATIGAVLPGDFKIKKSKLRGIESFGMLCSEKEMGLAEQADGLMELPADAPIGADIRDYLQLNDIIIEVDLTPNRADCLSVAGVAREVATLYRCDINSFEPICVAASIEDTFPVKVSASQACPRYTGRVIHNVNSRADTPLWMVEKLRRSGIRSLGPCVDVTNFVMLELGQPMHAFDLAGLKGGMDVRMAHVGEQITLLDGKKIKITENTLVIADEENILALAGIMGGENSGVTENTRHLFLESAHFNPLSIAGKAREYGLHTDSSHRFERGVDAELPIKALERATELMIEICGGQAGPVVDQTSLTDLPSRKPVQLRLSRINRLLGIVFDGAEVESILTRLGMQLEKISETETETWWVTPPGFRFDIAIEADLIEEIIRIHGYNHIPRKLPTYQPAMKPLVEAEVDLQRVKEVLVDRGYFEAISYSFVEPKWQAAIDPDIAPVKLANPISADLSVMRTSIWPGLLRAVQHNLHRQQSRVRLFETGLTFVKRGDELIQQAKVSGALTGTLAHEQWAESARKIDFFDAKADIEAILSLSGLDNIDFKKAQHPALHPGQTAQILKNNQPIGWLGALHPNTQKILDIDPPVYVFEIDQSALLAGTVPVFKPLSRFPEVRRDLALVVKQDVPVEDLVKSIKSVTSEICQEILLFDVYTGKGIDKGLKSIALGLILQGFSSTLTDEDVNIETNNIITVLNDRYGATLRE